MKSNSGLLIAGFLFAVLMKEAAADKLTPEKAKKFSGRTYLRGMKCLGRQIDFPEELMANSEDCLLNRVQRADSGAMFTSSKKSGDPVRKGPTCELACIMQTSDLIDADFNIDDAKVEEIIDTSFGQSKTFAKQDIVNKVKEFEKGCRSTLENISPVDDDRCTVFEPYATCVTNAFVKLCAKQAPAASQQRSAAGGAKPLLNVGGLLSLG